MTLYAFPMALAPTLVVPILVMMNLLLALRLFEGQLGQRSQARLRRRRADGASAGASGSANRGSNPVIRRAPLPKVM